MFSKAFSDGVADDAMAVGIHRSGIFFSSLLFSVFSP